MLTNEIIMIGSALLMMVTALGTILSTRSQFKKYKDEQKTDHQKEFERNQSALETQRLTEKNAKAIEGITVSLTHIVGVTGKLVDNYNSFVNLDILKSESISALLEHHKDLSPVFKKLHFDFQEELIKASRKNRQITTKDDMD